jgi:polyhydroxybutyrate depolymerase
MMISVLAIGAGLMVGAAAMPNFGARMSVQVDGRTRTFLVDRPERLRPGAGLILVWHGFGSNATEQREFSGFTALTESSGYVIAYPDGWPNAEGKPNHQVEYKFQDRSIDDVKFAASIINKLKADLGINPALVFSTGMSNGADMSYYLARQAKPLVRAIAPVAGCMMTQWKENPVASRMAIMEVHGTADTVTKWAGDPEDKDGWGPYLGTDAVVDFWVKRLRLVAQPVQKAGKIELLRFRAPTGSAEFLLYVIEGGGHDWPKNLGKPKKTTAQEIVDFFNRHRPR